MPESKPPAEKPAGLEPISFAAFLASTPPLHPLRIADVWEMSGGSTNPCFPTIVLHCAADECGGDRFYDYQRRTGGIYKDNNNHLVMDYSCRHCGKSQKTFALLVQTCYKGGYADILKLGEWPPFGPHTHPRLISLIGPDRELFLMGKRAENNGLGLGAFTYYRRVVENQKDRLIDAVKEVAAKVNCPNEIIARLEEAKKQPQFSAAVEAIQDGIPQVLLINGHNPIKLLHNALSRGIHSESDAECLELAATIRLVLGDMAERMTQALKEQAQLQVALSKLMTSKKKGDK